MDMSLGKLREFVMDRGDCCSPQDSKELDTTVWLNWTETFLELSISKSL